MLGFSVMAYVAFAADQVKTTDTYIYSSEAAVSTAQNAPINLYLGDNMSGVTNPMKSLYFVVSGVYTTGGTLALDISGDGATTQTFTLPAVSSPTPFEFIYKDPSNKINPTSAGAYTYTLNMTPAGGVVLYGLGVKMSESHRYVPPTCADGVPSNEKVKTTDTYIYSSEAAVSTAQNAPINLYLGDNMSGVTNPMKSLYFVVSGVYTTGGTLALDISGDGATTQTFTLPAVSSPTPFEFIYKDPSNKINPTSAGAYTYTLNMTPVGGVVLYGLGVKMSESHRYVPPTCGTFPVEGKLISAVFETTGSSDGAAYNSIMWKGQLAGPSQNQGKVRFQIATSNCIGGQTDVGCTIGGWGAGDSDYIGGSTCSNADWYDPATIDLQSQNIPIEITCAPTHNQNNKRYFKYRVQICSNDCFDAGTASPIVDDVVVNWAP